MPVYCSAANCYSNSRLNEGMHFYRFPKERERCLRWAQASGRLDLYERGASHLYNNFSLCERHFEPCQFMNDKRKRLIWKAIPTIFEVPKSAVRVRRRKARRATASVRRCPVACDDMAEDSDVCLQDDDVDLQFDECEQRLTKGEYIDMPGYCSAPDCSSAAKVDFGMHFFRFPKDEDRCKIWIRNSQRFDLSDKDADYVNANCRLCERHFEETQFTNRETRARLIWKAVPTLFDFPEISDLVCAKRNMVSGSNICSKRSRIEDSLDGLNRTGRLVQKNSYYDNGSKSIFGKKIVYNSTSVGSSFTQQVLPSVQSVVQSAKQLGMKDAMADYFEDQLQKCLEDEEDTMSSTKDSEAAKAVDGAQASLDESSSPKARIVMQQCLSAKLLVRPASESSPELYVQINRGIIVYICLLQGATSETVKKLAKTVLNVRLSETEDGRMVSVLDLPGEVLIIPQATLGGRIKGSAMQYHKNIDKTVGEQLYNEFVRACQHIVEKNGPSIEHGCGVLKGTYGNRQALSVETNGPYSHIIEM